MRNLHDLYFKFHLLASNDVHYNRKCWLKDMFPLLNSGSKGSYSMLDTIEPLKTKMKTRVVFGCISSGTHNRTAKARSADPFALCATSVCQ